jgi:hemerythrin-like domain-containing protein
MQKFYNTGTVLENPISIIENVHAQHAALCDTLEAIADSLPEAVDPELCASVLDLLKNDLPLHHKDEEEGLFPLLQQVSPSDKNVSRHLEQLSWEHSTDESLAHEIADALEKLAEGKSSENPNMLGYMLRAFFEGYRRHLHWENTVLLPLARERLSENELRQLSAIMAENRCKSSNSPKN